MGKREKEQEGLLWVSGHNPKEGRVQKSHIVLSVHFNTISVPDSTNRRKGVSGLKYNVPIPLGCSKMGKNPRTFKKDVKL